MASEIGKRAAEIMATLNPDIVAPFRCVMEFLEENPWAISGKIRKKFGTEEYLQKAAQKFSDDRRKKIPSYPETVPDPLVTSIMRMYWKIDVNQIENAIRFHNLAMSSENVVGHYLEAYIAEILEPRSWSWCSGSLAKAIDFVKMKADGTWIALQVKNRDNSENSSSNKVRTDTEIKKWHRTFSKKPGSNWSAFPDMEDGALSEEAFQAWVSDRLRELT